MRSPIAAASLVASLAMAAPVAWGQAVTPPADPRVEEARAQYRNGVMAFSHNHFAEATVLFERSYHLRPHPVTLFNAAEARFRAGDITGALDQLRELLGMTNPAPDAELIARVHALGIQMGDGNLQPAVHQAALTCPSCPPPPPPTPCPPPPAPVEIHRQISPAAWALAGGSLVLVGVGAGLFAVASDYSSVYMDPATSRALQLHLQGSGTGYAIAGTLLGLAGVGSAIGAVWLITHPHEVQPTMSMAAQPLHLDLAVGPSSVGVTGTF